MLPGLHLPVAAVVEVVPHRPGGELGALIRGYPAHDRRCGPVLPIQLSLDGQSRIALARIRLLGLGQDLVVDSHLEVATPGHGDAHACVRALTGKTGGQRDPQPLRLKLHALFRVGPKPFHPIAVLRDSPQRQMHFPPILLGRGVADPSEPIENPHRQDRRRARNNKTGRPGEQLGELLPPSPVLLGSRAPW